MQVRFFARDSACQLPYIPAMPIDQGSTCETRSVPELLSHSAAVP
jgi:hypothetical protein